MKLTKKNLIITGLILFVAFLIESRLFNIGSLFSFIPMFGDLITNVIDYIAILVCLLIITKQYFSKTNFFKAFGLIAAFIVVDKIISTLLTTKIITSLVYQIIRPIIAVALILLAVKLISNSKVKKDLKLLVVGIVIFIISVVSNILEYIRFVSLLENMGNDLLSYINILTNSAYNVIAVFCSYLLIFIAFVVAQKSISQKIMINKENLLFPTSSF